jgi:hypothetical protein
VKGEGRTTIQEFGPGWTVTAKGLDLSYFIKEGKERFQGRDLEVRVERPAEDEKRRR